MDIPDQDSHLALIVPIVYTYKSQSAPLWDVYQGQSSWSVTGVLAQGRGAEETPIRSSPQFLVHNWSGVCQSPGTPPQSSSQCEE